MMTVERENILKSAQKIFMREGFYKTPVDEIAFELKISKKTIYKNFSSKEELIREALLNFLSKTHDNISILVSSDANAVEKSFKMFGYVSNMLVNISENFISDIKNYMPDLWKEIDNIRSRILYKNLKSIIEQGQIEGFFIGTESDVLVTIFIISIRGVVNPDSLISNKLSPAKAAESIIEILMNGILTAKGKKVFEKLKTGAKK